MLQKLLNKRNVKVEEKNEVKETNEKIELLDYLLDFIETNLSLFI